MLTCAKKNKHWQFTLFYLCLKFIIISSNTVLDTFVINVMSKLLKVSGKVIVVVLIRKAIVKQELFVTILKD